MNKKNLILLIILLILIGLAVVYQFWWLPRNDNKNQEVNFLAKVDIAKVDKIIVKRNGTETVLIKAGDKWKVQADGDWRVNNLLMEKIVQVWQGASNGSIFLASGDKETKDKFKTDGSLSVKMFEGDKQAGSWAIGLTSAGYNYVSPEGSDSTYGIWGDLRSAFDYVEWRDFSIWEKQGDFNKITIRRDKESFVLEKNGNDWVLSADKKNKVNQERIAQIAALMENLSASSIAEIKTGDTGLDKSKLIIEAEAAGSKRILIVGKEQLVNGKASGEFFVKTNQNNNIYLITKEQKSVLEAGKTDLLKK